MGEGGLKRVECLLHNESDLTGFLQTIVESDAKRLHGCFQPVVERDAGRLTNSLVSTWSCVVVLTPRRWGR